MFERQVIDWLLETTDMYILTLFLVSLALFFVPVFIASHTIPLLTEMIPEQSKGKAAGEMLFVSTIWSFLWSVVTSIVFFEWIWVFNTWVIVGVVLCLLAGWVLYYYKRNRAIVSVVSGVILWMVFYKTTLPEGVTYAYDSAYQEIQITTGSYLWDPIRVFKSNGGMSSAIYEPPLEDKRSPFKYINEAITLTQEQKPSSILVIWSAWFVYPMAVSEFPYIENIDTVDIDPRVKEVTQMHFLQKPLDEKITFYPYSARYIVRKLLREWKSYELIFLDAYNGKSLPSELVTKEFFQDVQQLLTQEWFLVANLILDSSLESSFSKSVRATMNAVFVDGLSIKNITNNAQNTLDNFLVTTLNTLHKGEYERVLTEEDAVLYTDDHHAGEIDGVRMLNGM